MSDGAGKNDEELIARVCAGEEDAFRELCDRHRPAMEAAVRRRLSPAVRRKISVADVLQDARLAAYRGLEGFEPEGEGTVAAWLTAIADKKALHAVRRFLGTAKRAGRAEVTRGARADTHNFAGDATSPSQHAMGLELAERIRRALEDLPPDYRLVIDLRQRDHLPFAEVAERMGRSAGAVKMLYGRAVTRLGELLDLEGNA